MLEIVSGDGKIGFNETVGSHMRTDLKFPGKLIYNLLNFNNKQGVTCSFRVEMQLSQGALKE